MQNTIQANNIKTKESIEPVSNILRNGSSVIPERFNTISGPIFGSILPLEFSTVSEPKASEKVKRKA